MATYQQGCVIDGLVTVYGLVQRITKNTSATIVTAADENGAVAAAKQINPEAQVQFEFVYDTTQTLPDMAAARTTAVTMEYGSTSAAAELYLVESIEDVENNAEYRRATISARRWLENGVPGSSTGA